MGCPPSRGVRATLKHTEVGAVSCEMRGRVAMIVSAIKAPAVQNTAKGMYREYRLPAVDIPKQTFV